MLGEKRGIEPSSTEPLAKVPEGNILSPCLLKIEIDAKPFSCPSFNHIRVSLSWFDGLKKDFAEGLLPFHRGVSFGDIRKCSGSADLCAKGQTITEVAGHGSFGDRMKCWSVIGTGIETGFASDASFFIRHDGIGSRGASPGTGRADRDAGRLFTVLTDNGYEDGDLFPLFHPYPREGRAAGALMGEAADHFTGLASRAAFRNDGDGTHLDDLRR
jgi:hypothetical protein